MIQEWNRDTTRLDILQEVAKIYYYREDYDSAYFYYQKFVEARETRGLDIYAHEDIKIGLVYQKMGFDARASDIFNSYADYCEKDQSVYKSASKVIGG